MCVLDKKITVIVPCYNEEDVVRYFYSEITKVLIEINYDYEIVFIDDGSIDETLKIIRELASIDKKVKYLSFSRNFGKEAALYAGFCNSDGDYTVIMDVDMQDPPYIIKEMVNILESGDYECVATSRKDRTGENKLISWLSQKFYKIINRISDTEIVENARDFRMMKRDMVDAIISMSEHNRFSKGIFSWVGFKTYWLQYENVERAAGKTKWNIGKLFKYAIEGIVNFSQVPLSIASWFGVLMTLISFLFLVIIVLRRIIFGDPVAGWASQVCIIIFIGGIQLFCIGIIGQYIAKMYIETKNRPHFIVTETNKDNYVKIK